jgi:hypothetical protein
MILAVRIVACEVRDFTVMANVPCVRPALMVIELGIVAMIGDDWLSVPPIGCEARPTLVGVVTAAISVTVP